MYDYEISLFVSGPLEDVQGIILMIELDLVAITQWMDDNRLKLNVEETAMLIGSCRNDLKNLSFVEIKINGCTIVKLK
jgi:hypothetical protein